jgi:hypothetical protein
MAGTRLDGCKKTERRVFSGNNKSFTYKSWQDCYYSTSLTSIGKRDQSSTDRGGSRAAGSICPTTSPSASCPRGRGSALRARALRRPAAIGEGLGRPDRGPRVGGLVHQQVEAAQAAVLTASPCTPTARHEGLSVRGRSAAAAAAAGPAGPTALSLCSCVAQQRLGRAETKQSARGKVLGAQSCVYSPRHYYRTRGET